MRKTETFIFKGVYSKPCNGFTKNFVILGDSTRCSTDLFQTTKDSDSDIMNFVQHIERDTKVVAEFVNTYNDYQGKRYWNKYIYSLKKA